MKTKILLIAVLGFFALAAYGKNREADKKQRVKEFILNYSGNKYDQKKVMFYEDERLVLILSYDKDYLGNWKESFKDTIVYSKEGMTCEEYILKEGKYQDYAKVHYTLDNKRIIREVCSRYYENVWIELWKTDYLYSGNDLKQWIFYLDYRYDGDMVPYIKADFNVEGRNIKEILHSKNLSGTWQIIQKDTFAYSGNKLASIIRYVSGATYSWHEKYRDTMSYANDFIEKINRTFHHPGNAGISNTFNSNEYGYCNSITQSEGCIITYQYEDGIGNAEYFFYAPKDYFTGPPRLKTIGVGAPEVTPDLKGENVGLKQSFSE